MPRTMPVLAALLALAPGGIAAAQERAAPATGASFIYFRYASESSISLYAGYRTGPVELVAGMLQNPRSEYREIMGGVAKGLGGGGLGLTLAPALAWSNTGWYAQLYLLPGVQAGPVDIGGTIQLCQPLEAEGVQAVYASPLNALVRLGGGWSAGVTYFGSFEEGSRAGQAAGPALRRAVPGGSITIEPVLGLRHAADEVRVSIRASL